MLPADWTQDGGHNPANHAAKPIFCLHSAVLGPLLFHESISQWQGCRGKDSTNIHSAGHSNHLVLQCPLIRKVSSENLHEAFYLFLLVFMIIYN